MRVRCEPTAPVALLGVVVSHVRLQGNRTRAEEGPVLSLNGHPSALMHLRELRENKLCLRYYGAELVIRRRDARLPNHRSLSAMQGCRFANDLTADGHAAYEICLAFDRGCTVSFS